jgi:hypothetical protein
MQRLSDDDLHCIALYCVGADRGRRRRQDMRFAIAKGQRKRRGATGNQLSVGTIRGVAEVRSLRQVLVFR